MTRGKVESGLRTERGSNCACKSTGKAEIDLIWKGGGGDCERDRALAATAVPADRSTGGEVRRAVRGSDWERCAALAAAGVACSQAPAVPFVSCWADGGSDGGGTVDQWMSSHGSPNSCASNSSGGAGKEGGAEAGKEGGAEAGKEGGAGRETATGGALRQLEELPPSYSRGASACGSEGLCVRWLMPYATKTNIKKYSKDVRAVRQPLFSGTAPRATFKAVVPGDLGTTGSTVGSAVVSTDSGSNGSTVGSSGTTDGFSGVLGWSIIGTTTGLPTTSSGAGSWAVVIMLRRFAAPALT